MEEFSDKTTKELEALREQYADNSYVPGSKFHAIGRELERRHRKKLEEALEKPHASIGILNQGKNAKFIGNTFQNNSISENTQNKSTDNRPFWKKPEWFIPILIALASIPWLPSVYKLFTNTKANIEAPTNSVITFSRGADFLSVKMDHETKMFSVTNEAQSFISLSIYDVSFDVGDITVDNHHHEIIPLGLGAKTTFSSLGFATTSQTILPKQKMDFDPSKFPLVGFDPWIPINQDKDYDKFYCFLLIAQNSDGQKAFYPIITSKIEFISGFDNPRPQNSGVGGGYQSELVSQNLQNEIEVECQQLYSQID